MCGLVYMKSFKKESVVDDLLKRYNSQRTRGTSGFGFLCPATNMRTRHTEEDGIIESLKKTKDNESYEILFHHRQPTSTTNVVTAAHPFTTGRLLKHNYVLAHNGIIWNQEELKKEHDKSGVVRYESLQANGSFNDSESLLWEIAQYLEGITDKVSTQGGAAFIMVESAYTKTGARPIKLHFGRNASNPLWMQLDDDRLILASEHSTWDDAEEIMPNYLYTYNYRTKTISIKPLHLETYSSAKASRGLSQTEWEDYASRPRIPAHTIQDALDDRAEDEYWEKMGENYSLYSGTGSSMGSRHVIPERPKQTQHIIVPEDEMTDDQVDTAADNMLAGLLDKFEDLADVEYRLRADLSRAQQATSQLGEKLKDKDNMKPKSLRKYYKYSKFLKVTTRALQMYKSIVTLTNQEITEAQIAEVLDESA